MPETISNGDSLIINGETSVETQDNEENTEEEIHFNPILPLVDTSNNEEDEVELIKMRAKLYRYEKDDAANDPGEWKERGTGEVKLLKHTVRKTVRVVMRRDKTLKICANHFVTPWMELKPNCGSDRAWVWSVMADFADEKAKTELLAIRFANTENAKAWKQAFEGAKKFVEEECEIYAGKPNPKEKEEKSTNEPESSDIASNESDQEDNSEKRNEDKEKVMKNKDTSKDDSDEVVKEMEKLDMKEEK